ncbi:MAG: OsmC family protein [Pseudomonadales bacterium]|nr:OsmC family protein [Pseudomonadales bacterium]
MNHSIVSEAQAPLRIEYKTCPEAAMVTDHAHTSSDDNADPFHAIVAPMPGCGVEIPVGVHSRVGGLHDAPTPGDILCAALAACQDSSIRMVANLMGIELENLAVTVEADVDVRGTLMVDKDVPVGFQAMRCEVQLRAKAGTDSQLLQQLSVIAEQCCVVQQTMKNPPKVNTTFKLTDS